MHETAAGMVALAARDRAREAELVLLDIAREGRQPTFDERQYFREATGWEGVKLDLQLGRVQRVVKLQAIAGTGEQRRELDRAAAEADEALATTGSQLADLIAATQGKLAALESRKRTLDKRREEAARAIIGLRDNAPDFAKSDAGNLEADLSRSFRHPIESAHIEIRRLRRLLGGPPAGGDDLQLWKEAVRRDYLPAINQDRSGRWALDQTEYQKRKLFWQSEVERLEAKVADLQSRMEAAIAGNDSDPLSYHVPE